jgi:hypothetical protein
LGGSSDHTAGTTLSNRDQLPCSRCLEVYTVQQHTWNSGRYNNEWARKKRTQL